MMEDITLLGGIATPLGLGSGAIAGCAIFVLLKNRVVAFTLLLSGLALAGLWAFSVPDIETLMTAIGGVLSQLENAGVFIGMLFGKALASLVHTLIPVSGRETRR